MPYEMNIIIMYDYIVLLYYVWLFVHNVWLFLFATVSRLDSLVYAVYASTKDNHQGDRRNNINKLQRVQLTLASP